jgi:hypothetical protein
MEKDLVIYKVELSVSFEADPNIDEKGRNFALDVVYEHDRKDFDSTKER